MSFIVKRHSKALAPNVYLSDDANVQQPWRTSLKQAKRFETKLAAKKQAALALIHGGNDTYVVKVKTKRTLLRVGDFIAWGNQSAGFRVVGFDETNIYIDGGRFHPRRPVNVSAAGPISFVKKEGLLKREDILGPVKGLALLGGAR